MKVDWSRYSWELYTILATPARGPVSPALRLLFYLGSQAGLQKVPLNRPGFPGDSNS